MSPLYQFLLVLLLAIVASAKVTVQGFMSRRHLHSSQDNLWFNSLLFVVIVVLLLILFPIGQITTTQLVYGALTSFTCIGFQYAYSVALKSGPVSLTVLIGNFNVLLTTAFSCLFLGDKLYWPQLLAIVFLVISMFLATESKGEETRISRKWLLMALFTLFCAAVYGVGQKLFLATDAGQLPGAQNTELIFMYLCSSLIGFILYAFNARKGEKSPLAFHKPVMLYSLAIGLILGVYQRLNIYTMAVVEGSFHFPTYAGLQSLTMTLVGIVLFKDRLSKRQMIGVVCGILSVILMNMRLGTPLLG